MSKKQNQNQHSSKKQIIQLSNLKVANQVIVMLPKQVNLKDMNTSIVQGYIKSKLKNKKITIGQYLIILYLGRQRNILIHSIDGTINTQQKIQSQNQNSKHTSLSYIFGETTSVKVIDYVQQNQVIEIQNNYGFQFFGFQQQLKQLIYTLNNSLFQRQQLLQNGLGPINGILISGYSGAGKSAILCELKKQFKKTNRDINWVSISSVRLLSRVVGGAEEYIKLIFDELKKKSPSVLTIQDIHLVFGQKESSAHETTMAALLGQLQNLYKEQIVVICTYNTDRQLNKNMRSSGKFQKQVVLTMPNHIQRLNILKGIIDKLKIQNKFQLQELKKINLKLNGFSVGEIKQIIRDCFCKQGSKLSNKHVEEALKKYRPAQIKQLIVEVPEVRWGQIGGYANVKQQIKTVVQLPLTHADKFNKLGVEPSKGILLYGPPGCSKTMMAKAIATECGLNFIGIKGPQLFSKYVGESEKAIRNIFKRARACSPCVIFFDQIDAIATSRTANTQVSDRVLCQLLNEMDGIEGLRQVAIVAATNRPQILDKALMRPGRFDKLIYISPPDVYARKDIFAINLSKSCKQDAQQLAKIMAEKTNQYTGAEIALVCRQAVMLALKQNLEVEKVQLKHLQQALKIVKKRLTWDLIARYQKFSQSIRE